MQNFRELGWVELGYLMVEDNNKTTKQLIDFRGYPSPQLELELSWQVGAKVDQLIGFASFVFNQSSLILTYKQLCYILP